MYLIFHVFHVFHAFNIVMCVKIQGPSVLTLHILPPLLVPPGLQTLVPSAAFTRETYKLARLLCFIKMAFYPVVPPDPLLEVLEYVTWPYRYCGFLLDS